MDEEDRIFSESECLEHLDRIERDMARTPAKEPPPEGVANFLLNHCGPEMVPLLAARLAELAEEGPDWKARAVILYLGQADDPAGAEALVRLASVTPDDEYRELASLSLALAGDPALALLEAELAKPELAPPARLALEDAAARIRRGEKPEV